MKKVFISYSQDSDEHRNRVLELANKLRNDEVQVIIDHDMLPGGPPKGWPKWSEAQVEDADFVLIACTETYCRRYDGEEDPGKGQGSACEARAIRQLIYDLSGENKKFRVIVFQEKDSKFIPLNLRSYHHYPLYKSDAYGELLQWLQQSDINNLNNSTEYKKVQWSKLTEKYEWQIANREIIYNHFTNIISGQEKKRIMLLSGDSGKGKTVLLNELRNYAEKQKIATAFLDFSGCPTLDDLFETMLQDINNSLLPQTLNAEEPKRQHRFISDLKNLCTPLILVLDAYEQASEDAKRWMESHFLLRLKQTPAVTVIIAGQRIPVHESLSWNELTTEFELPPITKVKDWQNFVRIKWGCNHITKEHVEALTIGAKGDPALIFSLLETFITKFQAQESN